MPKYTQTRVKTKKTTAPKKTAEKREPPQKPVADLSSNIYISPNNVAKRWDLSRSTVDRIAKRMEFTQFLAGEGKNGTVRYLKEDVIAYEKRRLAGTPQNI